MKGFAGKVTVVIPAHNEAKTIRRMISRVRPFADDVLVILSKRSRDRTRAIVSEMGVPFVVDNGVGKGDALRLAIKAVKEGIIVFIDADGSHAPEDIPRLVAPIRRGSADMVIGSRMTGGSDELYGTIDQFFRLMFSNVITLMINYRFGQNITDYQNGFRALRADLAKKVKLKENLTTIEQEISIKFLKKGYRLKEVPTHEFDGGKSSFNIWKVGHRYFWQIIRDIW